MALAAQDARPIGQYTEKHPRGPPERPGGLILARAHMFGRPGKYRSTSEETVSERSTAWAMGNDATGRKTRTCSKVVQ
jgi:hypothetical protein